MILYFNIKDKKDAIKLLKVFLDKLDNDSCLFLIEYNYDLLEDFYGHDFYIKVDISDKITIRHTDICDGVVTNIDKYLREQKLNRIIDDN